MREVLKPWEVVKALCEGEKLHYGFWAEDEWIAMTKDGRIVDENGEPLTQYDIDFHLLNSAHWTIYEEPWMRVGDMLSSPFLQASYEIVYTNNWMALGISKANDIKIFERGYWPDEQKLFEFVVTRAGSQQ